MMKHLSERIQGAASWPRVGLLVLAYAACIGPMTYMEGRIKRISGDLGVPDLLHGFTAAELYARVYGTLFAFLLALSTKRLFPEGSRAHAICLVPLVGTFFDYLENGAFFTVLFAWPARSTAVAIAACVFNLAKWSILAFSLP